MSLNDLKALQEAPDSPETMPVVFVGHGSPMNAIEDNPFAREWQAVGQSLPRPRAILCVSAHWETAGTQVTAMEKPRTIHDFGGFPRELYEAQYPAPGSRWLAQATQDTMRPVPVSFDDEWGLDHGCWSVLSRMFPAADVPVVQISLDYGLKPGDHYALARQLGALRRKGVLIVGSGNIVHNLRRVVWPSGGVADFNTPFGLDWAIEANELVKGLINQNHHDRLINYGSLGRAVQLAVPTPEHYLPMLYILAMQQEHESVRYFNDVPLAGSLTMTSFVVEAAH